MKWSRNFLEPGASFLESLTNYGMIAAIGLEVPTSLLAVTTIDCKLSIGDSSVPEDT